MTELQTIFHKSFPAFECICSIVALTQYQKLKDTYWKWFVIYILFITGAELFNLFVLQFYLEIRKYFFGFFIIPIEFIFFYWLYAKKSLQMNNLFWISCSIYIVFYVLYLFNLSNVRWISSMSYSVGAFLLSIMIFLELIKQIKSDEILNFKTNKMFYINLGTLLLYVGTLPFFAFDKYLYNNAKEIWDNYFTFFLFSVNVMYLFFIASFIWGKHKN